MRSLICYCAALGAAMLMENTFTLFEGRSEWTTSITSDENEHENFVFIRGNEKPKITYAKRKGKYMRQKGVTLPKV